MCVVRRVQGLAYLYHHASHVCIHATTTHDNASAVLTSVPPKLCRAALQLAVDAPTNSLVAKHAAGVLPRPQARLLTKELNWPVLISILPGHDGAVLGVAITKYGANLISGSADKTIK